MSGSDDDRQGDDDGDSIACHRGKVCVRGLCVAIPVTVLGFSSMVGVYFFIRNQSPGLINGFADNMQSLFNQSIDNISIDDICLGMVNSTNQLLHFDGLWSECARAVSDFVGSSALTGAACDQVEAQYLSAANNASNTFGDGFTALLLNASGSVPVRSRCIDEMNAALVESINASEICAAMLANISSLVPTGRLLTLCNDTLDTFLELSKAQFMDFLKKGKGTLLALILSLAPVILSSIWGILTGTFLVVFYVYHCCQDPGLIRRPPLEGGRIDHAEHTAAASVSSHVVVRNSRPASPARDEVHDDARDTVSPRATSLGIAAGSSSAAVNLPVCHSRVAMAEQHMPPDSPGDDHLDMPHAVPGSGVPSSRSPIRKRQNAF